MPVVNPTVMRRESHLCQVQVFSFSTISQFDKNFYDFLISNFSGPSRSFNNSSTKRLQILLLGI